MTERQVPREVFSVYNCTIVFFDHGETRIVKKTDTQKPEKVQIFTFQVKFPNRFMNF